MRSLLVDFIQSNSGAPPSRALRGPPKDPPRTSQEAPGSQSFLVESQENLKKIGSPSPSNYFLGIPRAKRRSALLARVFDRAAGSSGRGAAWAAGGRRALVQG